MFITKNNYKAKPTNGFPSKLENAVHDILLLRQRAGEIRDIKRQQAVILQDGPKEQRISWKVDFSFEELSMSDIGLGVYEKTWRTVYCEAKGIATADFLLKLKLWRKKRPYPLEIWKGDYRRPKLVERIE